MGHRARDGCRGRERAGPVSGESGAAGAGVSPGVSACWEVLLLFFSPPPFPPPSHGELFLRRPMVGFLLLQSDRRQ